MFAWGFKFEQYLTTNGSMGEHYVEFKTISHSSLQKGSFKRSALRMSASEILDKLNLLSFGYLVLDIVCFSENHGDFRLHSQCQSNTKSGVDVDHRRDGLFMDEFVYNWREESDSRLLRSLRSFVRGLSTNKE
ncbi:hypothetical protein MAR_014965 [Mya arenaria]|uniref:Uncharacterized protein n=1 Tax=Mya arenaria TaxID=6604 RepID=A0ABY7FJS8_MYAAR|nr:hypothetical protein MAR_014965 [Mya arenaria]